MNRAVLRLESKLSRERAGIGERHGVTLGGITLLGTATQLRSPGSVGIGELLLILFVLLTYQIPRNQQSRNISLPISGFLLVWASLSVVGLLFNLLSSGSLELPNLIGIGVPVLLLIVTTYVATRPSPGRLLRSWAQTFGWGFLGSQALLLGAAQLLRNLGPIELLWGGVRFQGWTTNPNQLAFLTLVAGFSVALSLDKHRLRTLVALTLTILIGLSTESDAFEVGVSAGLLSLTLSWVLTPRSRSAHRQRVAGVSLFSLVLLGIISNWRQVIRLVERIYESGDQGSDRVGLWKSCVDQILMSPLTGYGPGAHALLPDASFQMECHNTILDLATTGGVVLGGFALILFAKLTVDAWSRGQFATVVAITSMLTMGMFGFVIRYPAFWLLVCLVYTKTQTPDLRRRSPNRSFVIQSSTTEPARQLRRTCYDSCLGARRPSTTE